MITITPRVPPEFYQTVPYIYLHWPPLCCILGRTKTLGYKNIYIFFILSKGVKLLWCVRDRQRQRQTVILTHNNFFSRSYHAVSSSRAHLALLLLSWGTQPEAAVGCCPSGRCKLGLTHTDSNRPRLSHNICMHHFTMLKTSDQPWDCFFLFTQMHLVQRNLIDSSVKGQYATL